MKRLKKNNPFITNICSMYNGKLDIIIYSDIGSGVFLYVERVYILAGRVVRREDISVVSMHGEEN